MDVALINFCLDNKFFVGFSFVYLTVENKNTCLVVIMAGAWLNKFVSVF